MIVMELRPCQIMQTAPAWAGVLGQFRLSVDQASELAPRIDAVTLGLTLFSLFFIFAICGLILYFMARYRAPTRAPRDRMIHHPVRYEVVWVSIPTIIALGLFTWAAQPFIDYGRPPNDASVIYVVGKQWMWKVQHPGGRREINALHVPVGEPIKLVMVSQDVIHSFYVPAFRVKRDVLPTRYTVMWFTATKAGRYELFCAEYCGADHSDMIGEVVAMQPADYEQWLSADAGVADDAVSGMPGTPEAPLAVRGQGAFYQFGCNACHVPTASKRAPQLAGLWGGPSRMRNDELVMVDEQYIRESILRPNARIVAGYDSPSLMPSYEGQIDEQALRELIEFIRSLEHGWPTAIEQNSSAPSGDAEEGGGP